MNLHQLAQCLNVPRYGVTKGYGRFFLASLVVMSASACTEGDLAQPESNKAVTATAVERKAKANKPREITKVVYPDSEGKSFFNANVLPNLATSRCFTCHVPGPGYNLPEINYNGLFPILAVGQTANNNMLMYRLVKPEYQPTHLKHTTTLRHTGGTRCESENVEPCKSIKEWWEIEFPDRKHQ